MTDFKAISWPLSQVNEAVAELSRRSGLGPRSVELPTPPARLNMTDPNIIEKWVDGLAEQLEVDATVISTTYNEIDELLARSGPAVLRLLVEGEWRLVALLPGQFGGTVRL